MSVASKPNPHLASVAPIFPIAMAIAWILQTFLGGGDPLVELWRPLLITAAATGLLSGGLGLWGADDRCRSSSPGSSRSSS